MGPYERFRMFGPIFPQGAGLEQRGGGEVEEVPPTEDLMREHGVLNRLLLVYDEAIHRILSGGHLPPDVLHLSAWIIRDFVEDYHEQLEERWVFPRFEQAGQFPDLVRVLKAQHQRALSGIGLNLARFLHRRQAAAQLAQRLPPAVHEDPRVRAMIALLKQDNLHIEAYWPVLMQTLTATGWYGSGRFHEKSTPGGVLKNRRCSWA